MRWLIALWSALLALLVLSAPGRAAEEILAFHSRVEVQADGALIVREDITVRAEGKEIRRGIFRDFPLLYRRTDGNIGRVGFRVLQVLRDGQPENWFVRKRRDKVRIYAGRKDVFLKPGTYTYTFIYHTTNQLRHFEDFDELYWNVTGSDWMFPIRKARIEVRLPQQARIIRAALYTGQRGAQGKDARIVQRAPGLFIAETTRTLQPGEGFTIAVAFPKGIVAAPQSASYWWARLNEHMPLWLLGPAVALINLYFFWMWWRHGRDPRPGPVFPRWEPPAGLSPAATGWVHENHVHALEDTRRLFAAALVSLGVKGLVRLRRRQDGTLEIIRTTSARPQDLPPGERAIFEHAFADGRERFSIERTNEEEVRATLKAFDKALEEEYAARAFQRNYGMFFLGVLALLVALGAAAVIAWWRNSEPGITYLVLTAFLIVIALILVPFFLGLRTAWREGKRLKLLLALPVLAGIGGFYAVVVYSAFRDADIADLTWPMIGAGLLLAGITALWNHLIRRPTELGRRLLDDIEGLRLFIRLAEQDRLNMPGVPQMSPSRFETLLPYAIALGMERPWTAAFQRWLQSAMTTQAQRSWQPRWHEGGNFSAERLPDAISTDVVSGIGSSLAQAMPARSSSGSGGGGGVGGGGGGGGGGGW